MKPLLVLALLGLFFSSRSQTKADPAFSIVADSFLIHRKIQIESVRVLGIPYRLATQNMKKYHEAKFTLYPTNYDTLQRYIKNVVDLNGYKMDVIYFEFSGQKFLINSKDTAWGANVLYTYKRKQKTKN